MSEEINEANGNIREIQRLRGLLAQALDELHAAERERNATREALSNLLRLFAGYSVDTHEVGFCTVPPSDRRWIDEARRALGLEAA
jgi:hypothetical protein